MFRIAIITSNKKIDYWQILALNHANKNFKVETILNCNNSFSKRNYFKNFLYYVLNLIFYNGKLFKKYKVEKIFDTIQIINFNCIRKNNWEFLPEDILNLIKNKNLDLVFKFGMNLLKIPELEVTKYGFFSYHHGDSKYFRGRPACFYEFLNNTNSIGVVIQKLSNNIDKGQVFAKSYCKLYNYSFKKTVNNTYKNSTFLLNTFFINLKNQKKYSFEKNFGKLYFLPSNVLVAKLIINNIIFLIQKIFYGLFFYKKWNISIQKNNLFDKKEITKFKIKVSPNSKINNLKYLFYSDPFFINNNEIILEAYDKYKSYGIINIYDLDKKNFTFENILKSRKHSSFPSIFKDNNKIFFLPEIANWSNPKIFELNSKLSISKEINLVGLEKLKLIDSVLFKERGIYYLFTGFKNNSLDVCHLYYSDSKIGQYTLHPSSPIISDPIGSRMAGNIIRIENKKYRLGQNNSGKYGNGICIYEILEINKINYKEKFIKSIKLYDFYGPHSIDISGQKIVLDYYTEKFSLFAGFRRLNQMLKNV